MKYVLFALFTLCLAGSAVAHKPGSYSALIYSDTTKALKKPPVVKDSTTAFADTTAAMDSTYRAGNYSPSRVQVKGYYRKDGKYVAPYTRSAPRKHH